MPHQALLVGQYDSVAVEHAISYRSPQLPTEASLHITDNEALHTQTVKHRRANRGRLSLQQVSRQHNNDRISSLAAGLTLRTGMG
jgi:hypothetical protein